MSGKRAAVFYRCFRGEFFERLQKHSSKSVSLGSPNKDSKCEGNILAYKKNKPDLITIPYIKNLMRSVLPDLKHMHVTFYRCFDRLLGLLIINEFLR